MQWPDQKGFRFHLPPIGQGLAVVAVIAAIAVLSGGGVVGYLLSLHIAARGTQTRALDERLSLKRREVQQLRNELDFRSRFPELERWSAPLGLEPADGRQYAQTVGDLDTLAGEGQFLDGIADGIGHPAAARALGGHLGLA